MEIIGSQTREDIKDAPYVFKEYLEDQDVVLFNCVTSKRELWTRNDSYAGYVVVIEGIGYEFCKTLKGK